MHPRVLLLLLLSAVGLQAPLSADTFIVRPPPTSRSTARASIGPALVGERYCTEVRCIVVADTAAQMANLKLLESKGLVTLQEFPEARKVFFGNATWDGETQTFDRDFPGKTELASNSPESLFAVVFKSFPQGEWLMALHSAGFIVTEPLPTMAYLVYGDRLALQKLAANARYIYRVLELPAGLRRTNIDTYLPDDGDQPAGTLIALVNVSSSQVKKMLVSARGAEPPLEYVMNGIAAYSAVLDRATALYVSRFPEIVEVTRQTFTAAPSDERYNRIIAGDWGSPGTAWPSSGTIGVNTQPAPPQWFWENYLSHLSTDVPGFNLSNQTIAFLDTGVDNGLAPPTPGLPPCPGHLWDPAVFPSGKCRLTFLSDVTSDFSSTRGIDRGGHGTLTTSVAAGYVTDESGGRDADFPLNNPPIRGNYSFTHGVAQAANVAMTKFFDSHTLHCDHDYRQAGAGAEPTFYRDGYYQRARYSIVMMNGKNPLPSIEFPGNPPTPGPGASIFNHSWYADVPDLNQRYEAVSRLFDQTTRNPAFAFFDFGAPGAANVYYGTGDPILHVVATGNYFSGDDHTIQAPGLAKNVLTVGATETYNQEGYTNDTLCSASNDASHADNTNEIATFSRISPDTAPQNYRYKPEVVAPGTRAYGRRSSQYTADGAPWYTCFLCNPDLTHNGQYAWYQGTSFSAPVVAGAAAITREWLRVVNGTLHFSDPWVSPSPALVKATLIAAAKPLPESTAPLKAQGFGGVSLDSLFRPVTNYYFFDQKFILPNQGNEVWEKTLVANGGDVAVALVWTDRFSASSPAALVNNLDLRVMAYVGGWPCSWFGNNFSNGYSHAYCNPVEIPFYDSVNTAEKVLIPGSQLPAGTPITIRVGAFSLTGDALTYRTGIYDPLHIDWEGTSLYARQDFALAVINAHE